MYIDYNGREIEDLEMENMRRDAREEQKQEQHSTMMCNDGTQLTFYTSNGFLVIARHDGELLLSSYTITLATDEINELQVFLASLVETDPEESDLEYKELVDLEGG
ncbi:MAG TPA: hypothetical protein VHV10_05120 [Ktedonobacteraceae bacterium]|jgi:hypothetical protein|nr:hypothetical protein [Ktedonobacteraceae bacterium]